MSAGEGCRGSYLPISPHVHVACLPERAAEAAFLQGGAARRWQGEVPWRERDTAAAARPAPKAATTALRAGAGQQAPRQEPPLAAPPGSHMWPGRQPAPSGSAHISGTAADWGRGLCRVERCVNTSTARTADYSRLQPTTADYSRARIFSTASLEREICSPHLESATALPSAETLNAPHRPARSVSSRGCAPGLSSAM